MVAFVILVLLFIPLIVKLFRLQVILADDLSKRALEQMTTTQVISSERGLIFDRQGKQLTNNTSYSDIYLDMDLLNKLDNPEKEKEALVDSLSQVLDMDPEKIKGFFQKEGSFLIAKRVERPLAMALEKKNLRSLSISDLEGRYYPNQNLASHVIGFINEENRGVYGLERAYDDKLRGLDGQSILYTDTKKDAMPGTEARSQAPLQGANLVLSLSENLQKQVEEILEGVQEESQAKEVMAIVQDNKTGEILAMAAKSDYNLNDPRGPQTPIQEQTWDKLTKEQKTEIWYDNWRNPMVSDLYEPGSTFKTITAAAALEEHTTDQKKHYYCTGYIRDLPGKPITCASLPNPHGDITMAEAFAESCNTTFVNIARQLGREDFYTYIENFGFGEKTHIDLPAEEKGLIPKSSEDISETQLATLSFGHGIAVTPIQMITAISAATNGGYLMEPHLVKEIRSQSGGLIKSIEPKVKAQVISQGTSEQIRELMEGVVDHGTGSLAKVDGYRVGGKTGTAEKVSDNGGYEADKYISSFVGIAPVQDPKVTVLVIVKEPEGDYYGATVAAPAAGEIMKLAMEEFKIPKDESLAKEAPEQVIVPDLKDMLLEDGGRILFNLGLKFNTDGAQLGDFAVIKGQSPAPGTEIDKGSIINLELAKNTGNKIRMPSLLGKDEKEVKDLLDSIHMDYEISGEGYVIEQNPRVGESLGPEDKVLIKLGKPLDGEKAPSNGSEGQEEGTGKAKEDKTESEEE
ncbi:MAG: penicillin-binding transpeptidase domain-containing protein [Tissierellia bacterium]|nr:penicillin-binding transpeptidase domain-containing protein [Tissierellia bacterium]